MESGDNTGFLMAREYLAQFHYNFSWVRCYGLLAFGGLLLTVRMPGRLQGGSYSLMLATTRAAPGGCWTAKADY